MFKNLAIKEEDPDNFVNPECPGDVKIEIGDSFIDSELSMRDLKSEDHETASVDVERILPIKSIYVQNVSAFDQLYFL